MSWKSDQYDVQGWLVFPLHYEPAKKYPLVVEVHGTMWRVLCWSCGWEGPMQPTLERVRGGDPDPRDSTFELRLPAGRPTTSRGRALTAATTEPPIPRSWSRFAP